MRGAALLFVAGALAAFAPACVVSPQREITVEAEARSSLPRTLEVGAVTVRISRAELALGPFYFCAAASGSATLCRSAVAEIVDVTRVDLLSPAPTPLGKVRGFTGAVRSASYDLGLHWLDTESAARPSSVAPDGHSLVIEGTLARAGEAEVPFRLLVDAVPQYQGQRAVPTAESAAELTERSRLVVTLDPGAWLRAVDLEAALAAPARPVVLDAKTPAHDAALLSLKVARPPTLAWTSAP